MRSHRNTGAPFEREDGTTWERGEVHEPTLREVATRGYKLEPLGRPEDDDGDAPEAEGDPLAGVDFGSDEAGELAEEAGLTAEDFASELGTGQGHAFLKDDVEQLAEDS